jgi:hypothetical protein
MKLQMKNILTIIMLNLFFFVTASVVYAQGSNYVKEGAYLGIYLTDTRMFGDFDNTRFYSAPGELLDVPYVDDGKGFGIVLGGRTEKAAFELGYQRTRHDTFSLLTLEEGEASYNIIDLNFKVDVFARDQVRPYILFGFGFPWLTVENGHVEADYYGYSFNDATFFGFALNTGAGLAYYFHPQWAVTGGVIYRWNWFTSGEGKSLEDNLLERAFCFNVGIAYTF